MMAGKGIYLVDRQTEFQLVRRVRTKLYELDSPVDPRFAPLAPSLPLFSIFYFLISIFALSRLPRHYYCASLSGHVQCW